MVKGGEIMVDREITSLFNDIYSNTNKKVLKTIIAKCSNLEDVSDIFQEVYTELYTILLKHGGGYIKNHEAFLFKITKQKLYRHYSLLDKVKSVFLKPSYEDGEYLSDDEFELIDIDDRIDTDDLIDEVNAVLAKKPTEIKKIFYMRFFLDMTISEIALSLSLSEQNVKNKLYRTIKELRKLYCEKEDM